MAWRTPKTDWKAGDIPAASDFNRIEGDTLYLKDEVDSHKAEDASTTAKGHVQLNNTVTSTSTTQAATANAVKTVNDGAKAYTDAHEQKAAPHSGHETPAGAQAKADAAAGAVQAELNTHKADNANPHSVKKADVGLGSVLNYGIATTAEAQAGTSDAKYMTPLKVKDAITKLALDSTSDVFVTGTYTGNDASTRTISLGFRPKAVIVMPAGGGLTTETIYGGLALDGYPVLKYNDTTYTTYSDAIKITNSGFMVYYNPNRAIFTNDSQGSRNPYRYIAFK